MKVYIVVKNDASGKHVCRVFVNVLSAEMQKRGYELASALHEVDKPTYVVESHDVY